MVSTDSPQVSSILHVLSIFLDPGQVSELRALGVQGKKAVCQVFKDHAAMARAAALLDAQGASGVYFTPNPLRPDLVGMSVSCRKADVVRRRWLLVDCDPVRPAGVCSTDAEKAAAGHILDRCRGTLEGAGLSGVVVGDSGNGYHCCYPIDLPADDASQAVLKSVVVGLDQRCSDERARVDKSTHDAPRIWKLYWTRARKGEDTTERPHRWAKLIEGKPWSQQTAEANTAALQMLLGRWKYAEEVFTHRPHGSMIERAKKYLEKMDPAISGQYGHDQTFHVACVLVKDFALSQEDAWEAIQDWNARCMEPWSEADLKRKLREAAKAPGPVGRLAQEDSPNGFHHKSGAAPKSPEAEPKKGTEPFRPPIPASQLKAGPDTAWIWQGFLGRGAITLMSALWKAGKTTLLSHLLKQMQQGGQFCGLELSQGTVLYVTEESEGRWAKRRDKLLLADHVEFLIRPFPGKPRWNRWHEFLDYVISLQTEQPRDLIVFDTLANLWPVRDENDASQVQSALMPLHRIVETSASLLLVHHTRKGDGLEATSSRGSGALTAFVDTIVELRRFHREDREDRRRVLTAYGRDEETPDELVIELTELDGYVPQGRRRDAAAQELAAAIAAVLPSSPPGMTFDEIVDALPGDTKPRRKRVFETLQRGVDSLCWQQAGEGRRGSPHRYWKISTELPNDPL